MRTTFDLPPDVLNRLRTESARRGGRSRAPMRSLVLEYLRAGLGIPEKNRGNLKPVMRNGHYIFTAPKGTPKTTTADVKAALEDWP